MKKALVVLTLSFILGMGCYAFFKHWIIVRSPFNVTHLHDMPVKTIRKQPIKLFYRKHDEWQSETTTIMWPENKTSQLKHLLDTWLTFMDEEKLMNNKVTLQSLILAANDQDAYLSFDRIPFDDQAPTMEKWLWIETLLKTIRENDIVLSTVRFLVHHQPMQDYHLDFSSAWPCSGFINETTML